MGRGAIEKAREAIEDYLLAGGNIRRVPECVTTIDWTTDTRFHAAARAASARGHKARKKKLRKLHAQT